MQGLETQMPVNNRAVHALPHTLDDNNRHRKPRAGVSCLLFGSPGFAQSSGSAIQGTVTDEQGAVMPGASVVVANVQTGFTRELVSDERGWYRATAIAPGDYEVRVTLAGLCDAGAPRPDRNRRTRGHRQHFAARLPPSRNP